MKIILLILISVVMHGSEVNDLVDLGKSAAKALKDRNIESYLSLINLGHLKPNKDMYDQVVKMEIMPIFNMMDFIQWGFVVIDARSAGNAGMIIINENLKRGSPANDFDPLYAIKRAGKWMLLADVGSPEESFNGITKGELDDFNKLKIEFKRIKTELKIKNK